MSFSNVRCAVKIASVMPPRITAINSPFRRAETWDLGSDSKRCQQFTVRTNKYFHESIFRIKRAGSLWSIRHYVHHHTTDRHRRVLTAYSSLATLIIYNQKTAASLIHHYSRR